MDRMEIHATSLQAFKICLHAYIYILDSIHVHFITQTFMTINFTPTDSSILDSSQLTTSIHWPCYCTCTVHIYVVIDANLCRFILSFVCMYCRWKISYQKRSVGIPLTDLTLPHLCACPNPGTGFPSSYVVVFWCSVSLFQMKVIVCFVGIVYHHCLEVIVRSVAIGVNCWPSLFRGDCSLCCYWCELLTITV